MSIVQQSHRLCARAEILVRRLLGRAISDDSRRRELESLYQKTPDPWKMTREQEQFRFVETNKILERELIAPARKVGSILEIGCGEGHQSEYFARLCDRLTGIDVVADAVACARERLPGAELIVGDLREQPWLGVRRFDIVTACEILYFIEDVPRMLDLMSGLGRSCLVTYFAPATYVGRALRTMPLAGRHSFSFGEISWHAAWWRSGE